MLSKTLCSSSFIQRFKLFHMSASQQGDTVQASAIIALNFGGMTKLEYVTPGEANFAIARKVIELRGTKPLPVFAQAGVSNAIMDLEEELGRDVSDYLIELSHDPEIYRTSEDALNEAREGLRERGVGSEPIILTTHFYHSYRSLILAQEILEQEIVIPDLSEITQFPAITDQIQTRSCLLWFVWNTVANLYHNITKDHR